MSVDIQQRQARNIGFGAFIFLIIIWTVKISGPNHDATNFYSNHTKSFNSSKLAFSLPDLFSGEPNATAQANLLTDEFGDYFNGTIFNKVAVIIEDSYRPEVIPLVLHFGSVLGPTWPILIYTSIEDVARFSTSAALSRYLKQGLIQIRNLPQTVLFTDLKARNKFMTDTWLWENLAPAEHILLFDSDSMLCSNAATSVDDFFAYDLVGTPVKDKGHRGGLSMRKRSSMLRVLENWDFADDMKRIEDEKMRKEEIQKKKEEEEKKKEEQKKKDAAQKKKDDAQKKKLEEEKKKKMDQEIRKKLETEREEVQVENQEDNKKEDKGKQVDKEAQVNVNGKEDGKQKSKREKKEEEEEPEEELAEDRWYQEKLRKLQGDEENIGIDPEEDDAVNMPTEEVTRTFSVESIDYPHPLGLHRVHKWKEDQMDKLLDWCPEYRLCSVSHHGKEFPTFANGGVGW
ncbi:uncharacterized protein EAF01_004842 [Botrytis porri]|uniref:DUF5672 domain-containing protein n=1 Tax=Botrytis porri TaxID=87229 RepID=A0A4Z1K4B0_9HELO|nr:uncharacterized protein EAF01_004842 [Botrytis porri]KAF7907255.1 hypothetical protein EAF01_004842 [Botrytis porri]TGO80939.1 hypothetical protein BPOR_1501g00010 [Botrytis porri]